MTPLACQYRSASGVIGLTSDANGNQSRRPLAANFADNLRRRQNYQRVEITSFKMAASYLTAAVGGKDYRKMSVSYTRHQKVAENLIIA